MTLFVGGVRRRAGLSTALIRCSTSELRAIASAAFRSIRRRRNSVATFSKCRAYWDGDRPPARLRRLGRAPTLMKDGAAVGVGGGELRILRAGADHHRVIPFGQHFFQTVDAGAGFYFDIADTGDVTDFFVDHRFRQTETRHLRAHEAAGLGIGFVNGDVVTQRCEVACHRQGGGSAADAGDAFAVFLFRRLRQARRDVTLVVGSNALQPADRHRLRLRTMFMRNRFADFDIAFFNATAAAGRFAWPVTGAAENAGKDIRVPVDHVGIAVAACSDQADVFGDGGVGRAGPLTIDNFMEVIGVRDISRFQTKLRYRCRHILLFLFVYSGPWRTGRKVSQILRL